MKKNDEPSRNTPERPSDGQKQNKLGVMPVGPLLVSMALPMMVSFFIQAMYNIVDSIFVARISEEALTAVSLAFPAQQIMNAIAIGTGVGISALIPRYIGMNDQERADTVANTGIFLNLCHIIVFVLLGFFMTKPFYEMQTTVPQIAQGGITYLRICLIICMGNFFGIYFEKMLTGTGNATMAMIAQGSGAVFNIIFDPLLIFGIGPFPRMGIAGAALATVLGQVLAAFIAFMLCMKRNPWIHISVRDIFKPAWNATREIYGIGIPSMITIGLTSVSSFLINQILLGYSTTATAVYGIWMKLQNFCFMPAFGMNNGMIPILSYNYGTGNLNRVKKTLRYALTSILMLMITLTLILEVETGTILTLFSASDNMREIGMHALRICVLSLTFGGGNIILSSSMQALRHARFTLIMNVLRNLIILTGAFMLLSLMFHDLTMLWFAVPFNEGVVFVIAVILYRKMRRHLVAR
ncbi:MAG: MATE family efflux transporter [Blautia sp.]|nr:MATE family efflux transporter [Blautia sp.]